MEATDYQFVKKPSLKDYTDKELAEILSHNEFLESEILMYITSEVVRRLRPHVSVESEASSCSHHSDPCCPHASCPPST